MNILKTIDLFNKMDISRVVEQSQQFASSGCESLGLFINGFEFFSSENTILNTTVAISSVIVISGIAISCGVKVFRMMRASQNGVVDEALRGDGRSVDALRADVPPVPTLSAAEVDSQLYELIEGIFTNDCSDDVDTFPVSQLFRSVSTDQKSRFMANLVNLLLQMHGQHGVNRNVFLFIRETLCEYRSMRSSLDGADRARLAPIVQAGLGQLGATASVVASLHLLFSKRNELPSLNAGYLYTECHSAIQNALNGVVVDQDEDHDDEVELVIQYGLLVLSDLVTYTENIEDGRAITEGAMALINQLANGRWERAAELSSLLKSLQNKGYRIDRSLRMGDGQCTYKFSLQSEGNSK